MANAIVYWVHLPEHTNIKTSGYVGVTRQTLYMRYAQHKSDAKHGSKLYFHNVIRKYGDKLIVEVFLEDDEELCYLVENELRPRREIGYNLAIGGECPAVGKVFSQEYRDNVSRRFKGTKHSVESRVARSESMKGAFAWENRGANKERWSRCLEFYDYMAEHASIKYPTLSKHYGYSNQGLMTIYHKIKSGWNPSEDQEYLSWLTNYNNKEATNA